MSSESHAERAQLVSLIFILTFIVNYKGPVRRAFWPLRSQSGLAAAKLLLKEVTLIPT